MDLIGQIEFEAADKSADLDAYNSWYKTSLNKTGKLELPSLEAFNRKAGKKQSRIEAALTAMKPPTLPGTPKKPMLRDITPLASNFGAEETDSQLGSIEANEQHIK